MINLLLDAWRNLVIFTAIKICIDPKQCKFYRHPNQAQTPLEGAQFGIEDALKEVSAIKPSKGKNMKKLALLCVLATVGAAHAEKFQPGSINDPANFRFASKAQIISDFAQLPLSGKLNDDRLAWSESFWPSNKGGIAYRWNSPNPTPFKYKLLSKQEVQSMSLEQLSELSPAELYDLAGGDYKYTLTKKVLGTFNTKDLWWEGICHGWALAAVHYPEPDKNIVTNKDGIQIPFGSSDVKALLAMHDAFNSKGSYSMVGGRCKVPGKVPGEAFPEDGIVPEPSISGQNDVNCKDTNAGAFHVVITNMIGRLSQGFVADVDRYMDVWNQPVFAYDSKIVSELPVSNTDLKNGINRKIQVKTKMIYGDELEFYSAEEASKGTVGFVSKEPVTGTAAQTFGEKDYEYVLELDFKDRVVGGEWISNTRPDFLWSKTKDVAFSNSLGNGTGFTLVLMGMFKTSYPLEGLSRIYKPVKR
jgi:hypothetical protein